MNRGEIAALCIVIDKVGSAPRDTGAFMIVMSNGEKMGTIGGYETEEPIVNAVMDSLRRGEYSPRRVTINFGAKAYEGEVDTGHICGGKFTVLIKFLLPREKMMIVGSGNVARALGSLASAVGMKPIAVDDNKDSLGEMGRMGIQTIDGETMEDALRKAFSEVGAADSIVIAHGDIEYDYIALREAVKTRAHYIGVLAGKRKASEFLKRLREDGVAGNDLVGRVFMPAGLDIGSDNPLEIAISIIAEIIRKKKGIRDWSHHLDLVNKLIKGDPA